jgi:dipeptidase E
MSLIFLSETKDNENKLIFEEIKSLLGNNKKIAYIPTSADWERKYFKRVEQFFEKIGSYELKYFGLFEGEWSGSFISEIGSFDAIYISGGNTYNLLYHIMLRKLDSTIKKFTKDKVVIGTSAGGIVLTPSIKISVEPNEFNLTNFTGLNQVDFNFYPHFEPNNKMTDELEDFINQKENFGRLIYAATNNSAISVVGDKIKLIGEVTKILITKEKTK